MTATVWTLDPSDGELLVRTGVAGRAARMGHRLTIAVTRWHATVRFDGADPIGVELVVETDSFEVLRGEGGVKGLSGPEKVLARSNALKSLDASRFPRIRFAAEVIDQTDQGYRLAGRLEIRGKAREHVIDLRTQDLGDSWRLSTESVVRQSEYGVRPYSLLMGSVQVADDVAVSFTAVHPKGE
ncbi:YceI family protein [Mycobacterium shigaense]|uniref:YceI family protein n=1 Tax=Mycobacterium shigaense TaxID=722731 RepID=UPI000E589CE7|nr:YceI family protein [Mycobacterium shigaense]MEA1123562.1 YceI family protein [Mycobacterium shigaense]